MPRTNNTSVISVSCVDDDSVAEHCNDCSCADDECGAKNDCHCNCCDADHHCYECDCCNLSDCDCACSNCGCGLCPGCECDCSSYCNCKCDECGCRGGIQLDDFTLDRHLFDRITKQTPTEINAVELLGDTDITNQVAEFYLLMAASLERPDDDLCTGLFSYVANTLATRLETYLIVSACGEARHCIDRVEMYNAIDIEASTLLHLLHNTQRREAWQVAIGAINVLGRRGVLEACRQIFDHLVWQPAYGGRAWAGVVETTLDWINNGRSPVWLVDRLVDVVHNGGWAFDKYYTNAHVCDIHGCVYLTNVLNAKNQDPAGLLGQVCLPEGREKYLQRVLRNCKKERSYEYELVT